MSHSEEVTEQRAVVDRVVDGVHAVLLVGNEELEVVVPVELLPDGVQEGVWLRIRLVDGQVTSAELDEASTGDADGRIADKLERLRTRGRRLRGDQ